MNLSDIAMLQLSLYYQQNQQKSDHKPNAKYQFDRKKWNTIKHKNLLSRIKMDKEIQTFADIEIEKNKKKKKKGKITAIRFYFFQKIYILRKYQYLKRFILGKKTIK